jgi:hypothetical protein
MAQLADVPVGFFLLAALALLATADRPGPLSRQRALLLAGLTLGLGAWTKNEGVLYLLCVLLAHSVVTAREAGGRATAGAAATLMLGASPMLAVLVYHRATVSPGWLLARHTPDALTTRLLDPARYQAIGETLLRAGLGLGGWTVSAPALLVLCALVWGLHVAPSDRIGAGRTALSLAFALLGIAGVYLVTPLPLAWQLGTSLPRILIQLWPSTVLLFALVVHAPGRFDEPGPRVPGTDPDPGGRPDLT